MVCPIPILTFERDALGTEGLHDRHRLFARPDIRPVFAAVESQYGVVFILSEHFFGFVEEGMEVDTLGGLYPRRLRLRLVDQVQAAGRYEAVWHGVNSRGAGVASGVYLYRIVSGSGYTDTKRMTLLK